MKIRSLLLSLGVLAAGAVVYAMQDGMGEMPQPSAEHKVLHESIGTWDAAMDMGMGEPSKGTMVVEAGPGGFTLLSHYVGDMMGMKFEGRSIDGYDSLKKKYISVWVDSMTDSPMIMEGTHDAKTNTTTMFGEMLDPASGKPVKHKFVTTWSSKDQMNFDVFGTGADGKDVRAFGIKYTRKK